MPAASRSEVIVDAHAHSWGRDALDLDWLATPEARVLRREHPLPELLREEAACGVEGLILVTAVESVAATASLLAAVAGADASVTEEERPRVHAVVGWVDLTASDADRQLDGLLAAPGGARLCGVRLVQHQHPPFAGPPPASLLRGCDALLRRGLVLEVLVAPGRLGEVLALARSRPRLPIVIDHLGAPSREGEERWRADLAGLAREPRVAVKLSGFEPEGEFGIACARFVLDRFGPRRVMAGSDWPILRLRSTLADTWQALRRVVAGCDAAGRAAVLGGTALDFYEGRS